MKHQSVMMLFPNFTTAGFIPEQLDDIVGTEFQTRVYVWKGERDAYSLTLFPAY